jgi:hypothetical protein
MQRAAERRNKKEGDGIVRAEWKGEEKGEVVWQKERKRREDEVVRAARKKDDKVYVPVVWAERKEMEELEVVRWEGIFERGRSACRKQGLRVGEGGTERQEEEEGEVL